MILDYNIMIKGMVDIIRDGKGEALLGMNEAEQKEFLEENGYDFVKVIGDK